MCYLQSVLLTLPLRDDCKQGKKKGGREMKYKKWHAPAGFDPGHTPSPSIKGFIKGFVGNIAHYPQLELNLPTYPEIIS